MSGGRDVCHVPECAFVAIPVEERTVLTDAGRVPTPAFAAAVDEHLQHEAEFAAALPVGPCPGWCTQPEHHPYEGFGDEFKRAHTASLANGLVEVMRIEHADGRWDDACLYGPDLGGVSAEQARQVGAALLSAADLLDEVQRRG